MKFKVGDRVAVYGAVWCHQDAEHKIYRGLKMEISKIIDENRITLYFGDEKYCAHPKQCRRLVKKEKRRVWVKVPTDFHPQHRTNGMVSVDPVDGWDEFVEVKKKL